MSIKKHTTPPSKEQMRQHLSEDYYSETQVKFASHFHQAFFFFFFLLFSTCMLANEVQKVKIYHDFYYTNFYIITDVVRSFVLLCLLSSLKHICNDGLVQPLQAQNTYISRGFHRLSLSFFFLSPVLQQK